MIDLLDLIKNVDHATTFTGEFTSVASRPVTDAKVLRRRLLLCAFRLGTNMGIRRDPHGGQQDAGSAPGTACASDSRTFASWSANRGRCSEKAVLRFGSFTGLACRWPSTAWW
ncbi:hypothetical protein ABZ907_38105 [Nonomuraea wenchangensis]